MGRQGCRGLFLRYLGVASDSCSVSIEPALVAISLAGRLGALSLRLPAAVATNSSRGSSSELVGNFQWFDRLRGLLWSSICRAATIFHCSAFGLAVLFHSDDKRSGMR